MASEKKILQVLDILTRESEAEPESLMPEAEYHRQNLQAILSSRKVHAIGISEKISKKKKSGTLALTFYVEKKMPLNKIKKSQVIPPVVPASMTAGTTILTDVIEIGKLMPEINVTRKPFQPGNSIGHFKTEGGTFGAVVRDRKRELYILSNSHVLADTGNASIGDSILYPGAYDTGVRPGDVKAKLYKFIPFDKSGKQVNVVDCAIAKPLPEFLPDLLAEIKGFGLPRGIIKAKRGMKVTKVGRTTGKTSGEITDVNFRATLDYKKRGLRTVGFKDQIFCSKRYTLPGDSGALVIDKASGKAVGLHFAGADGGSACNPIGEVLKALHVKLVTSPIPVKTNPKTKKNR